MGRESRSRVNKDKLGLVLGATSSSSPRDSALRRVRKCISRYRLERSSLGSRSRYKSRQKGRDFGRKTTEKIDR